VFAQSEPLPRRLRKKTQMRIFISIVLTLLTVASAAVAQSKKERVEIAIQSTSLTFFHPDFPGDDTQTGIGGRVTYNFNRNIAAEAEINFFPQRQLILTANGSAIQSQFGVKAGKRFEKFGLFAKARPGFLSVNDVGSFIPGSQLPSAANFKIERETFFTMDLGGVLELYPSKRTVVRFDAGDTVIRHPARFFPGITGLSVEPIRPAKFNHNFQFTAGVAFRLGDFPEEEPGVTTSASSDVGVKRFEVGAQFTSLLVEPNAPGGLTVPRAHSEPGFGGRFTFNATETLAFEAEGNYYTREQSEFHGGHMFQAQFGPKLGKRFERWGLFAKARPGFVGFSEVLEFPGFQTGGGNTLRTKLYPSVDVGGVVEFYVSRRWMARFDVGDTIIRYGEIRFPGVIPPFILRGAETVHNLQLSSGIGFRF
jgi:outer membrane protein with beta-barrel domain